MKLTSASVALLATLPFASLAQECLLGSFELEFDGTCTSESVIEAYEDQVFNAPGATSSSCAYSAEADLIAKLSSANIASIDDLCKQVYNTQDKVPFTDAANRGTDLHFEQMFYNGRTDWQEEVETIYETADNQPTSVLKQDAEAVRAFFDGMAQGRRVEWPGSLTNFQSSVQDANSLATCTTNAAMCCWPKDRQAGDNNGNCATPYDENCVDKDPADNTNLCYVDVERGNVSTGINGEGFFGYPEDNNQGEGAIHCHGLAWSNDVNDHTARYKANNLFFVSMYDHMYQRGYVQNIPGAPMCGCVEQMPTVSRSDCTQVDLEETIKVTYDAAAKTFVTKIASVHVDFNACRGINNRNNDLWAYIAKLYYQGDISPKQFGEAGRIITNTGCAEATRLHLNTIGLTRGYDHDVSMWTKVAGRDDLYDAHPYGKEMFYTAFWEHSSTKPDDPTVADPDDATVTEFPVGQTPILMRICASCAETHKKIWYRRLTPLANPDFDLLHNILYQRNDGSGENRWNVAFSLHSSYDDAVSGENPWKCPNNVFNYGASFYGECSPSGARVRDQYSVFNWQHGPRTDVAYYVNKPEATGIAEIDLSTNLRFGSVHTDVDLGEPKIEGRTFEEDNGTLHISGAGADIFGQNDEGHFFSEPSSGDIDVKVHVSAFTNVVDRYAKAGIMLRSDNSDDATHVMAMLSGYNGVCLFSRSSKHNGSARSGNWYQTSPIQKSAWLRLVKKMDKVEMYRSVDGVDWTLHGSINIRFPDDTFRVGLAVTSHDIHYLSSATFDDYSIEEYNFPTSSPSLSTAPTPWTPGIAIGGSRAGSETYYASSGISNYRGYGTGIWGSSDSFYYHNQQKALSDGAFDVVAYTERFHTGHMNARGGIMIRDTNDPDSAHAFIGMAGYYTGVTFMTRASAGEHAVHHQTNYVPNHKAWIKLSKPANSGVITAFYKINAEDEWMELGSTEISWTGSSVLVGTAVTAGTENYNSYADLQTKYFDVVSNPTRRNLLRA